MPEGRSPVDFSIVGAGLAGSALAALLAKQGRAVRLYERDTFPRDKLCGEFLSSASIGFLEQIGCLDAIVQLDPPKIERARFTAPSGRETRMRLPRAGWGVRRFVLDATLAAHAAACGAELTTGEEVRGVDPDRGLFVKPRGASIENARWEQAGTIILAHGRRSRLDVSLERPFTKKRHRFVAFKRHHRACDASVQAELRGLVEIHAVGDGYCGMSLVETGQINVCMLLGQGFVDRMSGTDFATITAALSAANPELAARLARLEPDEDGVLSTAEIPFDEKARYDPRGLLYVGDAAGMIAPLAGDGQAMALESAAILSEILADLPGAPMREQLARAGARWDRRFRRRFTMRLGLARHLQDRLMDAERAERTVRMVDAVPGLGNALARITRS